MTSQRPLVTFALFAYNQEKYIRCAVESALAQTYSPLVVFISDDASSDRTFDIIKEICDDYTGPHVVRCVKNEVNLGISAHVNRVNKNSEGELIVAAAGDDISVPNRVERIVENYLLADRKVHYLFSLVRAMTESGELQGSYQSPGGKNAGSKIRAGLASYPLAIGASEAWTKHLIESFSPLHPSVWAEDMVMGFRGRLLGPVCFIDEPLVHYRSGSGITNSNRSFNLTRYFKNQINGIAGYRQRAADAFEVNERGLALIIALKGLALGILLPISPIFSLMRRWERICR